MKIEVDLNGDALIASIEDGVRRACVAAFEGHNLAPGTSIAAKIRTEILRLIEVQFNRAMGDGAFREQINETIRAGVLEGARLGALEEGKKLGAKAVKGAAAVQTVQGMLLIPEREP